MSRTRPALDETHASPAADEQAATLADVRASARGDGAAYARVVRRFQQPLARRMARFTRDRRELEELVQEAFVQAYFSLPKYREEAPFEHWLAAIATRVGYALWKRRKRGRGVVALGAAGDVAGAAPPSEGSENEVLAVIERLPPRDRLVITLLHVEGRSVEEAARLTGWSRAMVKVQAFRARGKLRKLLDERESR